MGTQNDLASWTENSSNIPLMIVFYFLSQSLLHIYAIF